MNRRNISSLCVVTALGLALLTGHAESQQKTLKEQLTGTWALVSNDNVDPDGTKRQLFGANQKASWSSLPMGNSLKSWCEPTFQSSKRTTV